LPFSGYDKIAKFYDSVIGRSDDEIEFVRKRIHKYHPYAESVLEIGCGTGTNLLTLSKKYDVTGIDISREMLKIARKKIIRGNFHVHDIRNFDLKKKFDVILCLYDTINHLTLFNDWKKVFKSANDHLNKSGLFMFDINSLYKLLCVAEISPLVHKFSSNYLIMDVKKISDSTFNWNLKVFEKKRGNNFCLYESNIKESSFEVNKIKNELSKFFFLQKAEEETGKRIRADSERIYFICKKIHV